MSPAEAAEIIGTDQIAVARFTDGTPRAIGKVIAFSVMPQVLIEEMDGRRVWHRADMTYVLATEEG